MRGMGGMGNSRMDYCVMTAGPSPSGAPQSHVIMVFQHRQLYETFLICKIVNQQRIALTFELNSQVALIMEEFRYKIMVKTVRNLATVGEWCQDCGSWRVGV